MAEKSFAKVWKEFVEIPTYQIGLPEKNPMFLEKRVYQGSSGVVYPFPVIEKIYDEKIGQKYHAVFLENEYLKIMILPELGGRVQMAFDKIKQRHFVYYNQVIKPALVGLTGPWISGGIEFNWPQHHRPSTFLPVDFTIKENEDGSKSVWINEIDRMFGTKGIAIFTLHPGKAYLQVDGKLYNRTAFPQTFLWWANPAVKVNDFYQSVFPPDVFAVFDHGKRDVSSFPIAKGTYYKVNYAPGTDISRYKNIPVPTSYMAVDSKYNFLGGYENDSKGGLLIVGNHHLSPGKKQWTWGNGEFGQAWDRNLTDEDGPYIELMTGVFTDNQPDFSWLNPSEEKTFTQYFMPYHELGVIKNASKEAALYIEFENNKAILKIYATAVYDNVEVKIISKKTVCYEKNISLNPQQVFVETMEMGKNFSVTDFSIFVINAATKKQLISYTSEVVKKQEIPEPAKPAKSPVDTENNEQLFLTGLHLEQYRHATYSPIDYYEEALRRDTKDVRCNNALGLLLLRKGQFEKAAKYLEQAVATLTERNPNPYDGEAFYNLGWAYKMLGKTEAAYKAFYKSTWNDAWQHNGYFNVARIDAARGDWEEALSSIEKSVIKNYNSHNARHLKVCVLRNLNKLQEASEFCEASIVIDPFNYGCWFEKIRIAELLNDTKNEAAFIQSLKSLSRNWEHNFIVYALDYFHAGQLEDAIDYLQIYAADNPNIYPMVNYFIAYFAFLNHDIVSSNKYLKIAAAQNIDFCFPNRIEELQALVFAIKENDDPKAYYLAGNFLYDKRMYKEAIFHWEKSTELDSKFPTAFRNLALAYYNKENNPAKALHAMERAFANDTKDARILMELDQLYKKMNKPLEERLAFLEKHQALVDSREDLILEKITILNQLGEFEKAKHILAGNNFHPWEGGEGKVVGQHLIAHIELAKIAIEQQKFQQAIDLLSAAENYPINLGEGKLYNTQENDIHFLKGLAYKYLKNETEAQKYFSLATAGIAIPVQAIFYNDPQPDKIFYQGLAWIQLKETKKANEIFNRLVDFGKEHLDDHVVLDYFAVSLPDLLVFDADLDVKNKNHCKYLMALGYMGLGEFAKARTLFDEVIKTDINHSGAIIYERLISFSTILLLNPLP